MTAVGVRELLRDTAERLAAAGVPSPAVDAELLLAEILGVDRGLLVAAGPVDDATRARYDEAVSRRCGREPLQHIIGQAWFGSIDVAVGPGVFVPRPETEALLEWAMRAARHGGPETVVDLCSGSGALAIALAHELPGARVHAVELSEDALIWLRRNVSEQPARVAERIVVHRADVTDAAALTGVLGSASADLIVSNPPYIPLAAEAALDPEVREHDPHLALFGGADGMSVIRPMTGAIAAIARPGAAVGIEHDDTTSDLVVAALVDAGFADVAARADLAGRPRFVTGRAPAPTTLSPASMEGSNP